MGREASAVICGMGAITIRSSAVRRTSTSISYTSRRTAHAVLECAQRAGWQPDVRVDGHRGLRIERRAIGFPDAKRVRVGVREKTKIATSGGAAYVAECDGGAGIREHLRGARPEIECVGEVVAPRRLVAQRHSDE